jgi:hypothetical protein
VGSLVGSSAWIPAASSPHCAQDLACNGLALDALHHEAGAEPVVRLEEEPHLRDRDAAGVGRLEQRVLDAAVRLAAVPAGVAPQHEPVPRAVIGDGVERPALSRRPAREAPEPVDLEGTAGVSPDRGCELLGIDRRAGHSRKHRTCGPVS